MNPPSILFIYLVIYLDYIKKKGKKEKKRIGDRKIFSSDLFPYLFCFVCLLLLLGFLYHYGSRHLR